MLKLIILSIFFTSCISSRRHKNHFEKDKLMSDLTSKRQGLLFGYERNAAAEEAMQHFLQWPVRGSVSSYYGPRRGRFHAGIDIRANKGTEILLPKTGKIEFAGRIKGYGKTVIVNHLEFKTLYAHCDRLLVKRGQVIDQDEVIALVGTTGRARGSHLHFEVRKRNDTAIDPLPLLTKPGFMLSYFSPMRDIFSIQ